VQTEDREVKRSGSVHAAHESNGCAGVRA
jgi:hypothetical protein